MNGACWVCFCCQCVCECLICVCVCVCVCFFLCLLACFCVYIYLFVYVLHMICTWLRPGHLNVVLETLCGAVRRLYKSRIVSFNMIIIVVVINLFISLFVCLPTHLCIYLSIYLFDYPTNSFIHFLHAGQDMSNDRWEIADMMEKRRHNLQPAQSAPSIRTVPRDSLHKTDPGDSLLPRDDCSSSTPSRASLASTPNPETSPEQILPGESGCGEITKDSASRSPRPHQRRRKRQGSVRFHTGNSISDLESAGELDTSAAEESLQTPGTDGTDAEDDMSTSTTHAEIQPAQRGQISAVANVESEPEQPVEKPRSTSCPPAPRADNQQPFGQSVAKRSNSVDHFAGGNTSLISTTIHQQIARSLDGMWDLQQMVSTTARLTPEDAQQCLNTYQSSLMSPVPAVGWSQQVHDQSSQTLPHSLPDPVFKSKYMYWNPFNRPCFMEIKSTYGYN